MFLVKNIYVYNLTVMAKKKNKLLHTKFDILLKYIYNNNVLSFFFR
jgi:hypothetical protein